MEGWKDLPAGLVREIGKFWTIEPRGENWHGKCPVCGEDRFEVQTEREIFHCFACSWGGNMFTWYRRLFGEKVAPVSRVEEHLKRHPMVQRWTDPTTGETKEVVLGEWPSLDQRLRAAEIVLDRVAPRSESSYSMSALREHYLLEFGAMMDEVLVDLSVAQEDSCAMAVAVLSETLLALTHLRQEWEERAKE